MTSSFLSLRERPLYLRRDPVTGAVRALRLAAPPGRVGPRMRAVRDAIVSTIWPDTPIAPLAFSVCADVATAGFAAAAACDRALRAAGATPSRIWLDLEESELAELPWRDARNGLTKLRERGWRLGLRLHPQAPLALDGRTRALFAEFIAPGPALARAPAFDHPLWTRLLAGRMDNVLITITGGADACDAFEFDLEEAPLPSVMPSFYIPGAATASRCFTASSLSSR